MSPDHSLFAWSTDASLGLRLHLIPCLVKFPVLCLHNSIVLLALLLSQLLGMLCRGVPMRAYISSVHIAM